MEEIVFIYKIIYCVISKKILMLRFISYVRIHKKRSYELFSFFTTFDRSTTRDASYYTTDGVTLMAPFSFLFCFLAFLLLAYYYYHHYIICISFSFFLQSGSTHLLPQSQN